MNRENSTVPFAHSPDMRRKTLEVRYLDTVATQEEIHAHPFYEIYYYLEGAVERYVIGGRSYRLRPGDILMLPPGVPHYPVFSQKERPYRRYVLWLSQELMQTMDKLDPDLPAALNLCRDQENYRIRCTLPAVRQSFERYLQTMWEEEQSDSTCRYAHICGLCLNYLALLNRVLADEHLLVVKRQPASLLNQVLAYINANYRNSITLNSVAEHFYTSPSNIESLLTKNVKKPFYRYVTECRIIHAQALIASDVPLKEVGLACGYNDYSNFYRAFTREVGISPSQYRKHAPTDHFQSTNITEIT